MRFFRDKPNRILAWLQSKGESGTYHDALMSYFQGKSGLSSGTLYDHIHSTLRALGYSGDLDDMLSAHYISQTSVSHRGDAERAFWGDTSLDFGTAVSSQILNEDGTVLLNEDGSELFTEGA